MGIPQDITEQKQLLRSLFNIRMPGYISEDFPSVQDKYLQEETAAKGMPKIETSDNAFNIILPNLNTRNEQKSEEEATNRIDENEQKVMELAKTQGSVTRKEVEKLLIISQTTSGRLLKRMLEKGLLVQKGRC